ncbi:MAG: oligosaccharide flippase family protein [Chitinophagaceae bacterium]|nr:oligosaccharide flippase family protein [Chitinophagaceae bacterium]
MKKLLKQLVGESAIYGLSGMVSRFISIFLIPLYTSILSKEEYGRLSLVNSTFYFVTVLAVFAMDGAAARWYYDETDDEKRKPIMASWFWFQLGASLLLMLSLVFGSTLLSTQILHDSSYYFLFIVPALGLVTSILPTIVTNWLRFQRKPIHTVLFTLSSALLTILLNILFVVYLKKGIFGILLATLLANAAASIYVFFLMRKWLFIRYFSKKIMMDMLRYAYPLVPTAFAFWILNSSSAFVINRFQGQGEVGLFQIGSMIASATGMVAGAFQMAWGPFVFSIIDKPETKQVISSVLTLYTFLMSSLALFMALFAHEVLVIFTRKEYYEAASVAGVLSFNSIIYGFAYIAVIGCNVKKDNKPLALSVFAAALLTAFLYWLLVPTYGKLGAAISSAAGYLLVPVYLFYKSQQYWFIPFRFGLAVQLFLLAIGCFLVSFLIPTGSATLTIFWKLAIYLIYLMIALIPIYINYKPTILLWIQRLKQRNH